MSIDVTANWFKRVVPTPTTANFNVQLSCHVEEFLEMLQALEGASLAANFWLNDMQTELESFRKALRSQTIELTVADRKEFLDSLADQVVTAAGVAHMSGMSLPEALVRVNASNYSKFDEVGNPIFDETGKLKKGPTYVEPDLSGLY